ncbi:hypothetical protein LINGRAHAP2_LOCUS34872, partial [Linum grandiflorum]
LLTPFPSIFSCFFFSGFDPNFFCVALNPCLVAFLCFFVCFSFTLYISELLRRALDHHLRGIASQILKKGFEGKTRISWKTDK